MSKGPMLVLWVWLLDEQDPVDHLGLRWARWVRVHPEV
jgi:hypothetical protein